LKILNRIEWLAVCVLISGSIPGLADAGQGMTEQERMERVSRLMAAKNPLEPSNSVWIEELTYMEVRDRIAGGATTAIIPTGGVEENGPFLATGKHNYILAAMCPAIAAELGNALCAPIVPFVPEGSIDPPSGAMYFPGSISVRDETYDSLLDDIASSLKQHGFEDIVFIGDSGGNQKGMKSVAEKLNERWANSGVRAHFIAEFYTSGWEETEKYTAEVLGVEESRWDGHHDDIWVTAMMMVTNPDTVRHDQRLSADLATINGVDISDREKTIELGRKMVEFRARHTADAIRAALD
jgi:creatinine amidohydrolase/Fe(II)-dependent formamide hydrolase-like protein